MEKVSIIVPSYNHKEFIYDCLNSILQQDYKNIELIVIDDGSTDGTENIIDALGKEISSKIKNYHFIKKKNEGVSKTINLGLKKCTGEFITILASDDEMFPGRLKKQTEYMNKNNSFISCGNSLIIDGVKKTNRQVLNSERKRKYYKNQFENLIIDYFISTPTIMFKRKIINEFGLMNPNFEIEDWPYYVKVASKYSIDFIDENLCYYRLHNINTIRNKKKMFEEEKKVIYYFFNKYKLRRKVIRQAKSWLYLRNLSRNESILKRCIDFLISQFYYFDIKIIVNKIFRIGR